MKKSIYRSTVLSCFIILIGNMVIDGYIVNMPKSFAQQNNLFNPLSIPSTLGTTIGTPIKSGISNINPVINNFGSYYGVCNPINITKSLPTITSAETLTHSPTLSIGPQKLSLQRTVGPELFKFVYSYWTGPATSNGLFTPGAKFIETDVNSGPSFLAIVLHYEGTQTLWGVSAAFKLPPGFETTYPLIGQPNRYNIAISSYQNTIAPGNTIVLVFPVTIMKNVNIQTPYINSIALHYLRSVNEALTYQIDKKTMDSFVSSLIIKNNIPSPPAATGSTSTNTCGGTDTFNKEIQQVNELDRKFDFVNQFVPIIFTVTGQEVLNVNIAKVTPTAVQLNGSKNAPQGADVTATAINVKPTTLRVFINNSGDAPVYNLRALFSNPGTVQGTTSLTPLGFTAGQNGFPIGVDTTGQSTTANAISPPAILLDKTNFLIGYLPPHSSRSVNITAIANEIAYGTIANFNVNLVFTDVTGSISQLGPYNIGVLLSTSNFCIVGKTCTIEHKVSAGNSTRLFNEQVVTPPISIIPSIISKQLLKQ